MKFLQYLLVFLAIFYLVRLAFRVLIPGLFRMVIKRMGFRPGEFPGDNTQYDNRARYGREHPYGEATRQKEGDIRIEYIPPSAREKATGGKAGEFVEFEEMKAEKKQSGR